MPISSILGIISMISMKRKRGRRKRQQFRSSPWPNGKRKVQRKRRTISNSTL
jgi:hypothetical protein